MELDELKQAWARLDLRQDGLEALLWAEFRDRRTQKTRTILRWSIAARAIELVAWIAFTVCAASFWVDHRHVLHWLVIGLVLHAYGIAGVWASTTQLLLVSRVYLFDAPVVVLQRRLAQLRRFRVWCTLGLGLPWWCLWLPVSLAVLYWSAGVDGLAAGAIWFWATLGVGLVGIAFSVWLARHVAARDAVPPWLRRIVDDMSGRNLMRAARELDDLARFDRA